MANATLGITEGTGKLLDTESVVVGGQTVNRQRIEIAGASDTQVAAVFNGAPGTTVQALCVRHAGPVGQDHGVIITPEIGKVYVEGKVRTAIVTYPFIQPLTAGGGFLILAGVALKSTLLLHLTLTASVDTTVFIRDGSLPAGVIYYGKFKQDYPFGLAAPTGGYLCTTSVGNGLFFDCGVNCTIYGTLGYIQA